MFTLGLLMTAAQPTECTHRVAVADFWRTSHHDGKIGTPTKRQVSERQVSKRPVAKHPKRQVYKT
jgi:hypothetical protein